MFESEPDLKKSMFKIRDVPFLPKIEATKLHFSTLFDDFAT